MTDFFDQPSRRSARKKKKGAKRLRTAIILLVGLGLATAAGMWAVPLVKDLFDTAPDDYPGPGAGEVIIEISSGSSGGDIADLLVDGGVVASREAALNALNSNVESSRIQAGAYSMLKEMNSEEAVAWLLLPSKRVEVSITVPEGFTYWQVYDRMVEIFGFDLDEVKEAAADTDALGLPAEAGGEIEGWLAPDTYMFMPSATPTDVLKRMVSQTVSNLNAAEVPADKWEETLNAASIVEKEGLPEFFGEVARVISNRITLENTGVNGLLQMDSTVNYGLGINGGVPTREQIEEDTPWNTYIHPGLPKTPIGAPRLAAIQAVIDPPEGPWLYFVTVDLCTGETLFEEDYKKHQQNIELLREWREENPGNECS